MSLEAIAPETAPAEIPAETGLAAALTNALMGSPEPTAPAVVVPEPAAPVVPPVAAPATTPAKPDPVEAPAKPDPAAEPDPNRLPIDEELEPAKPTDEPIAKDKAGYRIQELKAEIATTYKPKIVELEQTVAQKDARILELEGVSTELEALRSFKSTYEKEMAVVELTKTEAYQTTVGTPLRAIADRAAEIAEAYGMDVDKTFAVIEGKTEAERRVALKELTSGLDLDDDDKFELRKLIADAQPLLEKKNELYANADKALLELQASREKETAVQAAERAGKRSEAAESIAKRVVDAMPFLKDAVPAVADEIKKIDPDALTDFDKVYNAMAGKLLGKAKLEILTIQRERDNLLDELEKYKGASPRVDGGFTGAPVGGTPHTSLGAALLAGLGHT
jgi:hypothetical protein